MAPAKSKMTPILVWEWVLVLSPIPVMVLAYVVLANTALTAGAVGFTEKALDGLCANGLPAVWCRLAKPATLLTAVQFLSFLWFAGMSLYLFWRVRFAPYAKPANYVPGAASMFEMASWAAIWLFMLAGGQVFPYRDTALAEPSLLFGMLGLSLGLLSLRMLVVALRFRH
ncbi:MAG: hypothetical protein ACK4JB_08860 [Reyranella sp.]